MSDQPTPPPTAPTDTPATKWSEPAAVRRFEKAIREATAPFLRYHPPKEVAQELREFLLDPALPFDREGNKAKAADLAERLVHPETRDRLYHARGFTEMLVQAPTGKLIQLSRLAQDAQQRIVGPTAPTPPAVTEASTAEAAPEKTPLLRWRRLLEGRATQSGMGNDKVAGI